MDLLNLSANERLDLADLTYAIFDSQLGLHRQIINNVVMDPAGTQTGYILSGFGLTNPAGNQLTVTRGVALLPYRSGSTVQFGLVSSEGSAAQTLDLSARAAGTYNVYITFTYTPGSLDTRTLWSPDNGGREYAQSVPTRQVAGWQLIVESVTPGAEYLQIGTVTLPSMAIVDQRPLLFEGRPDQAFASAWGSGTNDRSTSRGTYPVTNLATFVAAVQQCLVDIKGPGIAKWYTPYIAGQTIGFQGTAKAASTAWFDANFYIQGDANNPRTVYSSDGANLAYLRSATCFALQGGSGSASSALNFVLPSGTVGTKGPYSLAASASSFALMDTANAINPIVYSPSAESLDISANGLATVILPAPANVKYSAPQTVNQFISLFDGTLLSGLMFYPAGPTFNYSVAGQSVTCSAVSGELYFGTASGAAVNTVAATWICPVSVPLACTITAIEVNCYSDGTLAGVVSLYRKNNYAQTVTPVANTPATKVASVVATTTSTAVTSAFNTYYVIDYGTRNTTFTEPVLATDDSTYFVQLDLANLGSATTSADTASSARFRLASIKLTYTMASLSSGRRG